MRYWLIAWATAQSAILDANLAAETPLLAAIRKVEDLGKGMVEALAGVESQAAIMEENERKTLSTIAAKNGELNAELQIARAKIADQDKHLTDMAHILDNVHH